MIPPDAPKPSGGIFLLCYLQCACNLISAGNGILDIADFCAIADEMVAGLRGLQHLLHGAVHMVATWVTT